MNALEESGHSQMAILTELFERPLYARSWVREFAGFESRASHKKMYPIIDVLEDGCIVSDRAELIELMKNM